MSTPVCPICRKAQPAADYKPFCSRRCADVDLGRWFSGVYTVPAVDEEEGSAFEPKDERST